MAKVVLWISDKKVEWKGEVIAIDNSLRRSGLEYNRDFSVYTDQATVEHILSLDKNQKLLIAVGEQNGHVLAFLRFVRGKFPKVSVETYSRDSLEDRSFPSTERKPQDDFGTLKRRIRDFLALPKELV